MKLAPFARHALWLDGYGSPALVDDEAVMIQAVRDLAKLTGLDLHSTQIARVGSGEQSGISVQGLIVQSHIALHGWSECGGLMADIVSCQPWDYEQGRVFLVKRFAIHTTIRCLDSESLTNLILAARSGPRAGG
jgi:S-adenosylmethionine/arginine decarboxylase-like enzyme